MGRELDAGTRQTSRPARGPQAAGQRVYSQRDFPGQWEKAGVGSRTSHERLICRSTWTGTTLYWGLLSRSSSSSSSRTPIIATIITILVVDSFFFPLRRGWFSFSTLDKSIESQV